MAIFNEILVGRYNRALQKLFAIKGPPPVRQLGGEVTPVVQLFYGVENRFLEGWYRYANSFANGAVAGLTTAARFRNPAGSGMIAVIEKCTIRTAAADRVAWSMRGPVADANLGTPSASQSIERRAAAGAGQNSSIQISNDLAGNQQGIVLMNYNTEPNKMLTLIEYEDEELVVDPGQWFEWFTNLANNAFDVGWIWRERPLEESERQ